MRLLPDNLEAAAAAAGSAALTCVGATAFDLGEEAACCGAAGSAVSLYPFFNFSANILA